MFSHWQRESSGSLFRSVGSPRHRLVTCPAASRSLKCWRPFNPTLAICNSGSLPAWCLRPAGFCRDTCIVKHGSSVISHWHVVWIDASSNRLYTMNGLRKTQEAPVNDRHRSEVCRHCVIPCSPIVVLLFDTRTLCSNSMVSLAEPLGSRQPRIHCQRSVSCCHLPALTSEHPPARRPVPEPEEDPPLRQEN